MTIITFLPRESRYGLTTQSDAPDHRQPDEIDSNQDLLNLGFNGRSPIPTDLTPHHNIQRLPLTITLSLLLGFT